MKETINNTVQQTSGKPPVEFHSTQVLTTIQARLQQRYDVYVPYNVNQFVCHSAAHLQAMGGDNNTSPEMLFYRQDGDNLDISLFIDSELLQSIEAKHLNTDWSGESFNDCCILLEGVSHFLYLTWNAHYDRQVSLLDLELQAEVDKFVFAVLDTEPYDTSHLLKRLYQQISYRDELSPALKRRYEIANEFAQVYCTWLKDNFTLQPGNRKLAAELARFYRRNGAAKLQHIKELMH